MDGTIKLTTKRLILRKETMADAELLYNALGCDPQITQYTGWNPYATRASASEKVAEDIRSYEKPGCYAWIIQHGEEVVGTVGAYDYDPDASSIEIGYSIFRASWGNGFASEAVSEAVRYLFENERINRVHAWCHSENAASSKVLERAGLRQEGLLKQAIRNSDGSLSDQKLYGAIYKEWGL